MSKIGNEKNPLMEFLAGVGMLVIGLFVFFQKVVVTSSFFGFGYTMGGLSISSGVVIIPLIIGIVWMFVNVDSFGAKLLTAAGVLFIIFSVIMSTRIMLTTMTLFEWIVILVLIFGGLGLVARVLFAGKRTGRGHAGRTERIEENNVNDENVVDEIDKELEELKRGR